MFLSSTHTQVSYVKRARTHRLRAWACVDVYFKQCISQIVDCLDFSKFPAKTIVTKLVGSCQQSTENMNVFVQTTKNTCLIVDICFSSSRDCTNIKIWISKVQIHSSTMSFLLLVFFNPLLRYHAYVHQVPGKIINQAIELIRSLEN